MKKPIKKKKETELLPGRVVSIPCIVDTRAGNQHNTTIHFREMIVSAIGGIYPITISITFPDTDAMNDFKEGDMYLVQIDKSSK